MVGEITYSQTEDQGQGEHHVGASSWGLFSHMGFQPYPGQVEGGSVS
jgi:hypothetical protein